MVLNHAAQVHIDILDAQGRLMDRLLLGELSAGRNAVEWKSLVGSGLYFYRVLADGELIGAGRMVKVGY